MEWVETTGRTVEEAKNAALDRLGVDERDAEFDVVDEARSGLFGRVRQEARVRARVRPDQPRPRVDGRDRRRRAKASGPAENAGRQGSSTASTASTAKSKPAARPSPASSGSQDADSGSTDEGPTVEQVGEQARDFLDGLAKAFDVEAEAEFKLIDDLTVEARLVGDDLGLLVGAKGQTLSAIQDLTRAAAQNGPRRGTRLRVDIGGYQERRRDALTRFTRDVADRVQDSGEAISLEPMPAADRKVVHDTVNTVEGIASRSEGEDPRRRVIIEPS